MKKLRNREPLIVFSDDWGRHPSSCQHLVRRLLPDHPVIWVNTIGTRRPKLTFSDLSRGLGKIRQWICPAPPAAERGPLVLNPPMWPHFANPLARRLNTALLNAAVAGAIKRHLTQDPIVLTTVPLTADLVGKFPARRWVYYCVDDWATWPGLDHRTLDSMERDLLGRIDAAAAVSVPLAEKLALYGSVSTLITHGVDRSAWSPTGECHDPLLAQLAALPKPLAICWGLIDGRLDHHALHTLAGQFSGSIALIGPMGVGGQAMLGPANVHHFQPVSQPVLAHASQLADALLMFYRPDHPAMRQAQPLKLMEYLATDRPVISLDMVAARHWADCCDIVWADQWAQRVQLRALGGTPESQLASRARRLDDESWDAKAAQLQTLLIGRNEEKFQSQTGWRKAS